MVGSQPRLFPTCASAAGSRPFFKYPFMVLWLRLARSANSPSDRYLITEGSYCRSVYRGKERRASTI